MRRATSGRYMVVKKELSKSNCGQSVPELLQANPLSRKFSMLVFLVLFNLIFVAGCTYQVTRYEYKIPSDVEYDWGKVGVRLNSSAEKSTEREFISGPPYELSIWIDLPFNTKANSSAMITSVELYDAQKKKLVFKNDDILESIFKNYKEESNAYFSIKGLKLKYVRYKLVLRFNVKTDKVTTEDKATFYFEKDFEKYRSIKWWEALKGI